MTKILVIDDENTSCMSLGVAFSTAGHEVEMATSGRDAIDKGVYFRADVIVTDWMLRDGIDGLVAVDTIRTVHPSCHAILLTGFGAEDVRSAALDAKFFGFFEKPADHGKLLRALAKAAETPFLGIAERIGLVEHDADGRVRHLNARARELLGIEDGRDVATLREIFSYRSVSLIDTRSQSWEYLSTDGDSPRRCQGLALPTAAGRPHQTLLSACGDEDDKGLDAVRRLSGRKAKHSTAPVPVRAHRVLVIDRDRLQRRLTTDRLRDAGLLVHSAESCTRGLKTLEADAEIDIVVLDDATPGSCLDEVVGRIRHARPDAVLIGTSAGYAKTAFEEAGVERFVLKPVLVPAILELTRG